jgi:hypothetical protein
MLRVWLPPDWKCKASSRARLSDTRNQSRHNRYFEPAFRAGNAERARTDNPWPITPGFVVGPVVEVMAGGRIGWIEPYRRN